MAELVGMQKARKGFSARALFWYNARKPVQGSQMQSKTNWASIRAEFEQGLSQRSLALKYGISQSTISRRAADENWRIIPRITPTPLMQPDASPTNLSDIDRAIADLMCHLEGQSQKAKLQLMEHKLFADAYNQYNKIKLTLPPGEQDLSPYDLRELLSECTPEELAIVQPVFTTVSTRLAERKVKTLQKTG